jgi:hypothetical protein
MGRVVQKVRDRVHLALPTADIATTLCPPCPSFNAVTGNTKQELSLFSVAFVFVINAERWFYQTYFIVFYNCNKCDD